MTSTIDSLMLLLATLSCVLSLWVLYRAYSRHLSQSEMLYQVLEKSISSHNIERARKLCRAVGDTCVIGRIGYKLVEAAQQTEHLDRPDALQRVRHKEEDALRRESLTRRSLQAVSLLLLLVLALNIRPTEETSFPLYLSLGSLFALYLGERYERTTSLHLAIVVPKLIHLLSMHPSEFVTPPPTAPAPIAAETFQLLISGPETKTLSFPKTSSVIKIGDSETNAQVCLKGEGICRIHAVLTVSSEAIELIDVSAGVGTLVNDAPITKAALATGDVISIGGYKITLRDDSSVTRSA